MTPEAGDVERDEELERLLARWSAPPVPEGMDERVLAAYRRALGRSEPWWARLFTASVRVPIPVAIGLLMLFAVTALLALRPVPPQESAGAAGSSEPVQAVRVAAPVVTRTSLAGFQPVSEVTATVVETRETRQ
jgi:hypothetical protein